VEAWCTKHCEVTKSGDTVVDRIEIAGLGIDARLHQFVKEEILPGAGISDAAFWGGFAEILRDLGPRNAELLARRDELQAQIDAWHRQHPGLPASQSDYVEFLRSIGYLLPDIEPVPVTTTGVDDEIALQAGPQLVVPVNNPRFAINAANARWGSLYDAVYGSDVVADEGETARGRGYNPARGARVIALGRELLETAAPLTAGSHVDSIAYAVVDGLLQVTLVDGRQVGLADPATFVGYRGEPTAPTAVLLLHHGLHIEIAIDPADPIGSTDAAGVKDLVLESAVTTIMDLEDSVATVDAEDKVAAYRVWRGLHEGDIVETFEKGGKPFTRTLNPDREYVAPDGSALVLHGRSLLFIRHVGIHMHTDAVLDADGREIPEGFLDALVATAAAVPSLQRRTALANSRTGSVYVVKPKQHGPEEVAFTVELFGRIERLLGLPERTIKVGIMDEERRTSVNLDACIAAASDRLAFINTGFLDRTGDEIHTSNHAAPFLRKADLKRVPFLAAYERANVESGLAAGLPGHAQIGKGMWAMPDLMAAMLETKIAHPLAGATTAWVPSPTAATIHAIHYHRVDVAAVQQELRARPREGVLPILQIPLAPDPSWTAEERAAELDDNVQSILGYVVRWIEQGIGCSKVPDLADVALMEDRATLRISSQLLANWLTHGIITPEQVLESLRRISPVVDRQNAGDPLYRPLIEADGTESIAFAAARDLILLGAAQPNGYTEPILVAARRAQKAADLEAAR
jgi:malate synthase